MRAKNQPLLTNFDLIVFDFDGTIADSLRSYRELDQQLIKELYGVWEEIDEIIEFRDKIKNKSRSDSDDEYYLALDRKYGDGKRPLSEIYAKVSEIFPRIRSKVKPKPGVVQVIKKLKEKYNCKIGMATSSERREINFFSSNDSLIGREINLNEYFNRIVTLDDVKMPKPDPEIYQQLINFYAVPPEKVLVFEDSLLGITAAKTAGTTVIAIEDEHNTRDLDQIRNLADFSITEWKELVF